MVTVEGFVIQATYRIHHGIPVVYLFGRLVDGRTFTVRDNRDRPHFYIEREFVDAVGGAQVRPSEKCNFQGVSLAEVEVAIPQDAPGVRDALHAQGITTYEADIRFAMRHLIDRGIKGAVTITGELRPGQGTQVCFDNPHLKPGNAQIEPRVFSFDIETNPSTNELLAIAMHADGLDEVVVVDPAGREMPNIAVGVRRERDALAHFAERVAELDPDVLTGWNVIDFDLSMLDQIARRVKFDLQLGRERGHMRIRAAQGYFGSGQVTIPGRIVLDGIDLLRGAFIKVDDYSLDGVAKRFLGEGKTFGGTGSEDEPNTEETPDKVQQILDSYAHDLPRFTQYALTDARLALQISQHLDLFKLAFARSALTGMPPDRVAASIASFDFLYISALHARNIAAPSVKPGMTGAGPQSGGAVFEPLVGIHPNVWVCDFQSLYPSIIRTYNIDPLGLVRAGAGGEVISTHNGTQFSKQERILPSMLDELFPKRAQAKAAGDEIASQAIKILMNSCYGVLGTPACRFYNPALANAITSQGRYFLEWTRDWFEARGFKVLYGDTDSVFVASGIEDSQEAIAMAAPLMAQFNAELADHVAATAGVDSHLKLEFEKLYTKLFLAKVRGGSSGARKRYAGLRADRDDIEFVGMEVVRRDWTDLAKQVQRNLFSRMFNGDEVSGYLQQTVAELRAGDLDHLLVYRKGLRKPVSAYTTHVPPHVQAVKKSTREPPRLVHYVVTTTGPELVDEQVSPLDREHYLQRQVRPVAEPVLEVLGLDFEQVIGDDRQIGLF